MKKLISIIPSAMVLVAALIFGGVLLSNKGGVNLHHDHAMPSFTKKDSTRIQCLGFGAQTCQVFLTKNLTAPEDYSKLVKLLHQADERDTIYIYMVGNGGYVNTSFMLYHAIKSSKAHTVTIIVGDVYSGHAFVATAGKEIRVQNEHATIMFHTTSAYSVDPKAHCTKKFKDQTDRRQSAVNKCIMYLKNNIRLTTQFINDILPNILTEEEMRRVLQGHDVIITGRTLKERLKK